MGKPSYQRNPVEKAIDKAGKVANEVGKVVRRAPKDIAEGAPKLVRGAKVVSDTLTEGVRRIKRATR